jgi:8-oxo-dGTP diphosphatase
MMDSRYYLAVRAIIRDSKGRYLLIRRSKLCHHFIGKWEWPGGKVDKGEPFDVALRREIREEIGLKVTFTGVVGAYGFTVAKKQIAVLCMEAKVVGGKLTLSEEHDQFSWVPVKEMPTWKLTKGLQAVVKAYVIRKQGVNNHG